MKRLTKTTLVVLAIVVGTASGALAQQKSVRLDPVSKDLYQLTYMNRGDFQVMVEMLDKDGRKLFSEEIFYKTI